MKDKQIEIVTPRALARAATSSKAKHGEGSVVERRGKLHVRLSLGTLGRRMFALPQGTTEHDAEERRAVMAGMARELLSKGHIAAGLPLLEKAAEAVDGRALQAVAALAGKVARGDAIMKPGGATTIRDLVGRWTSGELARLYPLHVKTWKRPKADAACFAKYVYPVAGDLPVASFTTDHADAVMARIPANRAANTRRNVALRMHRLFSIAVYPLRLLTANPLPPKFLPKAGPQKAKASLHPKEDRALLGCVEIPLLRRMFYGFLIREGMRAGEALALRWDDLDLDNGAVRLDVNKTNDPRSWPLDRGVWRAILAWRSICEKSGTVSGRVFPGVPRFKAAEILRADLHRAGITRAEVFENSKARKQICVHDLRAAFVSISLANGRNEGWIMDRTGHRSSQMIARYRRVARTFADLNLGALLALDAAIPELRGAAANEGPAVAGAEPSDEPPTGCVLDPRNGSAEPKGVATGRAPSGRGQKSAEIATSRDASSGCEPFLNRWSAVQLCPGSPQ